MSSIGEDDSEPESPVEKTSTRSSSAVAGANSHGNGLDDEARRAPNIEPQGLKITEDQYNQESNDDDDDRPNRFEGLSSTWRFLTDDERALADSLHQQRANDLSIHLYNAHALKARVRDPGTASRIKLHESKRQWIKANEDGTLPWHPRGAWTAWPLEPEDVPRKSGPLGAPILGSEEDETTYRKREAWRPSGDVEEEMQALVLKRAKKQFLKRGWNGSLLAPTGFSTMPDHSDGKDPQSSSSSSGTDEFKERSFEDDAEHSEAVKIPSYEVAEIDFLADDEEAAPILQPTVQNLLHKLDDLLVGLHKNRKGHVRDQSKSCSKRKRSVSTSRNKKAMSKKGKKRTKTDLESSGEDESHSEDSVDAESEEHESHSGKEPNRQQPLNPRDWSEVIGIASLLGWEPAVIDRAARRCASLFGESMDFGPSNQAFTSTSGVESRAPESIDDVDIIIDRPKARRHICLIPKCRRKGKPFEEAWRWREHLKRSHKYSKKGVEELEASIKVGNGIPKRAQREGEEDNATPSNVEDELEAESDSDMSIDTSGVHTDDSQPSITEAT